MFSGNFALKKYEVILLVLAGSIVRILYGLSSHIWFMAHDQIAWSVGLEEMIGSGLISYKHMMHYPYEGGTFPISLLALIVMPFIKVIPALSVAALICDSISRYIQIRIARNIFGPLTATWFGLWSVFALPEMLPWGLAFFGLHAVNNVICFIFMYFVLKPSVHFSRPIVAALVTALAIMFSYHNIIFIPTYLVWILISANSWQNKLTDSGKFILSLLVCLVPHLLIRLYVDHGFNLETFALMSQRDKAWTNMAILQGFSNLVSTWYNALPASFFLSSASFLSSHLHRLIALLFMCTGLLVLVFKKDLNTSQSLLGFLLVLIFTVSYSFSVFFTDKIGKTSFYDYRHFSYIIPLLVLLIVQGFTKLGSIKRYVFALWILVCGFFSVVYLLNSKPIPEPSYDVAGWILSRKYGDDTKMLMRLYNTVPTNHKNELMLGFGWGLSTHLLRGKHKGDTTEINKLKQLYFQIPDSLKKTCAEGIYYSFQPWITPKLDPELLPLVEKQIGH